MRNWPLTLPTSVHHTHMCTILRQRVDSSDVQTNRQFVDYIYATDTWSPTAKGLGVITTPCWHLYEGVDFSWAIISCSLGELSGQAELDENVGVDGCDGTWCARRDDFVVLKVTSLETVHYRQLIRITQNTTETSYFVHTLHLLTRSMLWWKRPEDYRS